MLEKRKPPSNHWPINFNILFALIRNGAGANLEQDENREVRILESEAFIISRFISRHLNPTSERTLIGSIFNHPEKPDNINKWWKGR